MIELTDLKMGEEARICYILDDNLVRQRLLDIGFTKGSEILPVLVSPFKGPIAYKIKNTIVALRREDASSIFVEKLV